MKALLWLAVVLALGHAEVTFAEEPQNTLRMNHSGKRYGAPPVNLGEYLERLVRVYPNSIAKFDANYLYMRDGTKFPISDGRVDKTFEELLEKPDIDDMFLFDYPAGSSPSAPELNQDPGRVRYLPLFNRMYGDCSRGQVLKSLKRIEWLPKHRGGTILVTRANNIDKALERVSAELDRLPEQLLKYALPTAGTYNCRPILGTHSYSMHAYGAAIDLNVKYSHYWRWDAKSGRSWRSQMPVEIVRVFEQNGFIWGGHWYHYDTMHFEYRPELLN